MHHTDVRLIAPWWPVSYIFAGGGPPVGRQWEMPPSDCRLRVAGGPPVTFPAHSHW